MKIYETKSSYLYTLKDFVNLSSEDYLTVALPYDIHVNKLGWSSSQDVNINSILISNTVVTLWREYIVPKYLNSIIAMNDNELINNVESLNKIFGSFWRMFETILSSTHERYSTLISIYTREKDNLLNKIESININKASFNETPQTEVSDPYDTKYSNNTTVSENTSSTDGGTLMSRIKEIDDGIRNLYRDWMMEFDTLFTPNMED